MIRIKSWLMLAVSTTGLVCGSPGRATADFIAALPVGETPNAFGYEMVGWQFTTSAPITVTRLGWFVSGGLDQQVGIWDATGSTPLVQATLSPTDPQTDGFAYTAVTPVSLAPGDYIIASTDNGFDYVSGPPGSFSTASDITFVQTLGDNDYALGFHKPTGVLSSLPTRFGPNFQFITGASVPEPSSLVMGLISLSLTGGIVAIKRCRP